MVIKAVAHLDRDNPAGVKQRALKPGTEPKQPLVELQAAGHLYQFGIRTCPSTIAIKSDKTFLV
jgi:hypothetical protein